MKKRSIIFIILFGALGLAALQVPFNQLVGSSVRFTLFDFFGPLATGFIGTVPGIIAVALTQLADFFIKGAVVVDAGTIIRFVPMLFAAWYFGKKNIFNVIVPALAIIAFIANPIGRSAWAYSMFWLIPIVAYFFRDKSLILRALGTTFTAHAVGGALWVWVFGLSKTVWLSLIPTVAFERMLFAAGIALTYLVFNSLLDALVKRETIRSLMVIDPQYLLKTSR